MPSTPDLSDPILLSAWQAGKPISARALGVTEPTQRAQVRSLLDAGLLQRTLLSSVRCEKDGERLKAVDKSRALVCPRCSNTIELEKSGSLDFYTLHVGLPEVCRRAGASFESHGMPLIGKGGFSPTRDVEALGVARIDGEELEVLLAHRQVSPNALLNAWGYCAASGKFAALVHPGLSEQAESYLRLSFQACPILPIHTSAIGEAKIFEAARRFPRFRRRVASRLEGVESILFSEGSGQSKVDPFSADADELARHGGARYEPTALHLLSILGPTLRFSRRSGVLQVPDGILLLPGGVWLVDAKSAEKRFHYRQAQRDQVWRYLETVERRRDQFNDQWRFYGEILVTPTDQLEAGEVDLARADLRARGTTAVVSIVSHEGLRRAWAKARSSAEYWHRRNLSEDPRDLLLLHRRFLGDARIEAVVKEHAESPLRVVTGSMLDAYWDTVLENPYHGVGMRSPPDVLTRLEEMFIRDFGS